MRLPHPLRNAAAGLDAKVAVSDATLAADGIQIERTGRWGRTYRFDPAFLAMKQAEAAAQREQQAKARELAQQPTITVTQLPQPEPDLGPVLDAPAIEPRVLELLATDPLADLPPVSLYAQASTEAELTALLDIALTPTTDGRGWRA